MAKKSTDILLPTVHTYWDSNKGMICPLCESTLQYAFNDGGRKVVTIKGPIWVVQNYYRCTNIDCDLHKSFPMVYEKSLQRKKFDLGIWARVIQWHFTVHLNYKQISKMMNIEYHVSISANSVASICNYFESAGVIAANKKTILDVQANGKIILSADGAQPIKGEPALWEFSDRLTGHILLFRQLETASAEVLAKIYAEIEEEYGVPIVGVISDKQKSIVNSVFLHNKKIPHAFCQYHFLGHVAEGINSKDSHMGVQIAKKIKKAAIITNSKSNSAKNPKYSNNIDYSIFSPLIEELLCGISVKGDSFNTFSGLEIYKNVDYINAKLAHILRVKMPPKYKKTLTTLSNFLSEILDEWRKKKEEIEFLIPFFRDLRDILAQRDWDSKKVKSYVREWKKFLITEIKKIEPGYNKDGIKYERITYVSPIVDILKQWIRLEDSYRPGLYLAYDNHELEFTNNAKEQVFHQSKSHFKSLLGRQNVGTAFQRHAGPYSVLSEIDFDRENIYEILLTSETAIVEGYQQELNALFAQTKRNWRIRDIDTGNFLKLKENLKKIMKTIN